MSKGKWIVDFNERISPPPPKKGLVGVLKLTNKIDRANDLRVMCKLEIWEAELF